MHQYEDPPRHSFRIYFDMSIIISLSIIAAWIATNIKTNKLMGQNSNIFEKRIAYDQEEIIATYNESGYLKDFLKNIGTQIDDTTSPDKPLPIKSSQLDGNRTQDNSSRLQYYINKLEANTEILQNARKQKLYLWNILTDSLKTPIRFAYADEFLHFDSGKPTLRSDLKTYLTISEIKQKSLEHLKNGYNFIQVEGHTDNVPIQTDLYKDNWDLSAARAITIARVIDLYLTQNGYKHGVNYVVTASGFSEYLPVKSNETEDGRQNNRRIEISFLYRPLNSLIDE